MHHQQFQQCSSSNGTHYAICLGGQRTTSPLLVHQIPLECNESGEKQCGCQGPYFQSQIALDCATNTRYILSLVTTFDYINYIHHITKTMNKPSDSQQNTQTRIRNMETDNLALNDLRIIMNIPIITGAKRALLHPFLVRSLSFEGSRPTCQGIQRYSGNPFWSRP